MRQAVVYVRQSTLKQVQLNQESTRRQYQLAEQCRRYALSLPISTLVCGIQSLENLEQDVEMARHFTPMSEAEQQELLDSVHEAVGDGRFEWFKSTQFFDC